MQKKQEEIKKKEEQIKNLEKRKSNIPEDYELIKEEKEELEKEIHKIKQEIAERNKKYMPPEVAKETIDGLVGENQELVKEKTELNKKIEKLKWEVFELGRQKTDVKVVELGFNVVQAVDYFLSQANVLSEQIDFYKEQSEETKIKHIEAINKMQTWCSSMIKIIKDKKESVA